MKTIDSDVVVRLRLRQSALEAMVNGSGLPVSGTLRLDEQSDGTFVMHLWSAEIPDWPDPVPSNEAARAALEDSR